MATPASMDDRDVTRMLVAATDGDESAAGRLLPVIYDELRALASRYMRRERPDHTLQATALVHEAFLRLVRPSDLEIESRAHFFALAATAMRRILVNHAKAHGAAKRGGGRLQLELDEQVDGTGERGLDLIALDEAMTRLAEIDPQKASIVEMRFFGGLSIDETARALGVSPRTVRRDWTFARSWLRGELTRDGEPRS